MASLEPEVKPSAEHHGGEFAIFDDNAVSIFESVNSKKPSLFDLVEVAIVEKRALERKKTIPAPQPDRKNWTEHPKNNRKVTIWANFAHGAILSDFFNRNE